jgi:hypothetical protein
MLSIAGLYIGSQRQKSGLVRDGLLYGLLLPSLGMLILSLEILNMWAIPGEMPVFSENGEVVEPGRLVVVQDESGEKRLITKRVIFLDERMKILAAIPSVTTFEGEKGWWEVYLPPLSLRRVIITGNFFLAPHQSTDLLFGLAQQIFPGNISSSSSFREQGLSLWETWLKHDLLIHLIIQELKKIPPIELACLEEIHFMGPILLNGKMPHGIEIVPFSKHQGDNYFTLLLSRGVECPTDRASVAVKTIKLHQ